MGFIAEGENVTYIGNGEPDAPLAYGDVGTVIMAAGSGSHVHWKSGECEDHIYLTANARLQVIEASTPVHEEGYTGSEGHVHLAVCPNCNGEGLVPEE